MNGRDNRGRRRPFRKEGRNPGGPAKQEQAGQNSGRASDRNKTDSRQAPQRTGKPEFSFRPRKWGGKQSFDKNGIPAGKSNWVPPKQSSEPIPELTCARCGQPINDSSEALRDRNSGAPVHFACVLAELSEQEKPEAGDVVSYIGGGRFGIVHFGGEKSDSKRFNIKKIVEWEDKDKRAEWRGVIADHYSIT